MHENNQFEKELSELRCKIGSYISGKRYKHTLSVEKEIADLCRIFKLNAQDTFDLRVAALLHDITKEKSTSEHISVCEDNSIPYSEAETESPKVLHAMTAIPIIQKDLPMYARNSILSPVRWHTTGRENMTLGEKLLYLADYIESTRDFPDCVHLREIFYSVDDPSDICHLNDVLILSFEMTIRNLLDERAQIHPQTVFSLNSLLKEQKRYNPNP